MTVVLERLTRNICNILINRPEKRNALNLSTLKKFQDALRRFEEDDTYTVAVISGAGGNFCAGYDLNELVDCSTGKARLDNVEQMLWPLGSRLSEKKITIAAIDGHAAGFGYEIALKCDFRVAEKDARMGFLNRRFSIPIMNGGTVILPRLIGQARARELVATGKAQLAPEALSFGVITYIADVGCALGRSVNLARCLDKYHQPALLHDMRSLHNAGSTQLRADLQSERDNSIEYLKTCDKLESVQKFLTGELLRHGNTDMGNLLKPEPEVTL